VAPSGQLLRYATNNRILEYPEELDGFQCPHSYDKKEGEPTGPTDTSTTLTAPVHASDANDTEKTTGEDLEKVETALDLEKVPSRIAGAPSASSASSDLEPKESVTPSNLQRIRTLPYTQQRLAEDIAAHRTHTAAHAFAPIKTADGLILVDWYSSDDAEDPQNWSQAKKAWTAFLVCACTFVVYASSSIYVSSEALIMERFGVGEFKASLGLALYVLGRFGFEDV
jgi:DHA1 family multidrug resistance protein-like MFS transporter